MSGKVYSLYVSTDAGMTYKRVFRAQSLDAIDTDRYSNRRWYITAWGEPILYKIAPLHFVISDATDDAYVRWLRERGKDKLWGLWKEFLKTIPTRRSAEERLANAIIAINSKHQEEDTGSACA